jgi:tetratricopeptide (TPR) repeat protein
MMADQNSRDPNPSPLPEHDIAIEDDDDLADWGDPFDDNTNPETGGEPVNHLVTPPSTDDWGLDQIDMLASGDGDTPSLFDKPTKSADDQSWSAGPFGTRSAEDHEVSMVNDDLAPEPNMADSEDKEPTGLDSVAAQASDDEGKQDLVELGLSESKTDLGIGPAEDGEKPKRGKRPTSSTLASEEARVSVTDATEENVEGPKTSEIENAEIENAEIENAEIENAEIENAEVEDPEIGAEQEAEQLAVTFSEDPTEAGQPPEIGQSPEASGQPVALMTKHLESVAPAPEQVSPVEVTAVPPTNTPSAAEGTPKRLVEALPLDKVPDREPSWLSDYKLFKLETQKLARIGNWRKVAAMTAYALNEAPFATRMTRTSMLLDLAQLYRDRLKDQRRAEETFIVLADEAPASSEALDYLVKAFSARDDWMAVYELYVHAVEATWDLNERLSWTGKAADLAENQLGQLDLAIRAWERLWELGDAVDEAASALTRSYRKAERWGDMANFLRQQAERAEGPTQLVMLREVAEILLSGLSAPDEAGHVLEQIVERSPNDAIATLQLARVYAERHEWSALIQVGEQAAEMTTEFAMDVQHLVADALWQAERFEDAVNAYERILQSDPQNTDGLARKREFLTRSERYDELLDLLEDRADSTDDDEQRIALLAEAAKLAEQNLARPEKAAKLWESHTVLAPQDIEGFEALVRIYRQLDDPQGMSSALRGQLGLTKEQPKRVGLLRELGEIYARRLGDDDRAEECWKEILSLDPSDTDSREELTDLHKRRGDFESLNSSLMRQIWITSDEARAASLARRAAENLDQNFDDVARSVEAWRRVLDYSPLDQQALSQLATHYQALGNNRELIAVLEQRIRTVDEPFDRVELALGVAALWEQEQVPRAAAAAYERVLRWDPVHQGALDALIRIYQTHEQMGFASGAIDHVSGKVEQLRRVELLRTGFSLVPSDERLAKFNQLRRLLHISNGDPSVVAELVAQAEKDDLWSEVAAVLVQLVSEQQSTDSRLELLSDLCRVYEDQLEAPDKAYLCQQSALLTADNASAVIGDLERLADLTNRHEDLLAVLDRLTTTEFELDKRKAIMRRRAQICEKHIKDYHRAFCEFRRSIDLDASDWSPLEDLERLASAHDLWPMFDSVLAELWDRTDDEQKRKQILARREIVARDKLSDKRRAFEFLVRRFRADPDDLELLQALTQGAEVLEAWDWLLPVLEAAQLAPNANASADELMITAALYEEKLSDHDRAFALYREVFVMDPSSSTVSSKLEQLAESTRNYEQLADAMRMAAASSAEVELTLRLLRKIAAIYEDKLETPDRAIDIHRRIQDLDHTAMASLEVLIDWHRQKQQWRDLRDRLRQWLSIAAEQEDRVPKLLEIARISEQRLSDPEEALTYYGRVLELDADNEDATRGMNGLVSALTDPALRRRWLQMQLEKSEGERAAELRLELATLLDEQLEAPNAAIDTLRELVESEGVTGEGFERLMSLLEREKRHEDRVLLFKQRAEKVDDPELEQASIDAALAICHEHVPGAKPELLEALYREQLRLQPQNRQPRIRLARLLRDSGRFEELATLLGAHVAHDAPQEAISALYELARIQSRNLEELQTAGQTYQQILDLSPDQEPAILALASVARNRGNWAEYLTQRKAQAKLLSPTEGALVLCHLAEVCDEVPELSKQMVKLYREARTLDPDNLPAMEALKGIGRRLKNLRPAAALLPFDGERELSPPERAERLKALGDEALGQNDLGLATSWYQRTVAVDPDQPTHWLSLAALSMRLGDAEQAYRARRNWMHALMRSQPLDAENLQLEARRFYELATAARSADHHDDYAQLVREAFELVPSFAPAALARAQAQLSANQLEEAGQLLQEILTHHESDLDDQQTTQAYACRGMVRRAAGEPEKALDDFRQALRRSPLHCESLIAMGELQAQLGRYAAALEHLIRALMVTEAPRDRAQLNYRIGVLWEDGLDRLEEAGACYELAIAEGLTERDLFHRALRHYKRSGRLDESLDVVEGLLPTAEEPEELATLWTLRGEVLADREDAEDQAIEAFDMALSYDPSRQQARDGLVEVLERIGDWGQLLEVLEATADSGPPEQRALALIRMARLAAEQLGDPYQAEDYLRRSVEVFPTAMALQQMERIVADDPERADEHRDVLGLLVGFGPPWFERCLELGKLLLADEKRRAWCLLSPLLGVSQIDPDIKAVVQAMRKDYERPPLLVPHGEQRDLLLHPDYHAPLATVLGELAESDAEIGISDVKSVGESAAIGVGANTSLGKTFGALAEAMGLSNAELFRSQSLPEAVCVVRGEKGPQVVVRTDVMQQLVHAEVGFIFSYALELARPENRLLAALPADERAQIVPALWKALGFIDSTPTPAAKRLAASIDAAMDDDQRELWLVTLEPYKDEDPQAFGERHVAATWQNAHRSGLLAGADMRQAFRVLARMSSDVPRPKVVARLEDLDDYISCSELLQQVVAFSASPQLGALLASALSVEI